MPHHITAAKLYDYNEDDCKATMVLKQGIELIHPNDQPQPVHIPQSGILT